MKKGLLSILAVALTIVSCQNYDDQFVELTGLVKTLSTEVAGIAKVQTDLATVKSVVDNLTLSIAALPNNTASIAAISSGLTSATAQITTIEAALANGVASASDLANLAQATANVQTDIDTLLSENAAISVPISITSPLTLVNAQKFIKVGDGTPDGYLLNGNLTVDFHTASATLSGPQIKTANELIAKIISVTGNVSVKGAVNLGGLTYINGNYTIIGYDPTDATVANISGNLNIDGKLGALDLKHITTVASVVISNPASVTSVDFSGLTAATGSVNTSGAAVKTVVLANATGDINLGPLKVISITAVKTLGAITSTQGGTVASFVVDAPKSGTITANNIAAVTAALTITGSTTTEVYLKGVVTSGALNVANKVNELWITALASSVNGIRVRAGTVDASGLKTIATLAANFVDSGVVLFPTTGEINATALLDWSPASGIINIPNLVVSGAAGTVSSTTATSVTIASYNLDALMTRAAIPTITNLTYTAQERDLTGINGVLANIVALSVTGSGTTGAAPIIITPSGQAAMKSLYIKNVDGVVLDSSSVVSITTAGYVRTVAITGANAALKSLTVGHTYALQPIFTGGMEFSLNTASASNTLKSLDLSALTRLAKANISSNVALATITAPVFVDAASALQAGAGFAAATNHDYVIGRNALRATYTGRIAAVSNGSTNTPAVSPKLEQPSLKGWSDYIVSQWSVDSDGALAANNSATINLDFRFGRITGSATAKDGYATLTSAASGTIDTFDNKNEFQDLHATEASARPNNLLIR